MISWLVAVLLILRSIVVRAECPPCANDCPVVCLDIVPDPCGCCPYRCAASEGEYCSATEPCNKELVCTNTSFGDKCLCRLDKRMVCGTNNFTYNSICQMNNDLGTTNVSIRHWGPCDFGDVSEIEEFPPKGYGPVIETGPSDTRAIIGMPTALDCEAKGSPIPFITWTFTGKDGVAKVLPGDEPRVSVQIRGGPTEHMVSSWVQIVEAKPEFEGFYTCEAVSSRGSSKAHATLIVRPLV